MKRVEVTDWVATARELAHEGFEMLTCVDTGTELQLWLRTRSSSVVSTVIDGNAPSLSTVFAAATWKEREIHDMFGVMFDAPESNQTLFFSEVDIVAPLRKNVLLKTRNETDWPGFKDPTDTASTPARRKTLPLGVESDTTNRELL